MADFVADLHSGGSSLAYVPCVLVKQVANESVAARQRAVLEAFGAPHAYIAHSPPGQGADTTLSGGAERCGVPAIGTELGGSGTVSREALAIGERGVNNLLVHLGILPARDRIAPPGPTRVLEVVGADYFVYTPEAGLWEPRVELGEMVREGQVAARIHFPETPWAPPVEVAFERDGFVLCKRIPGRTVRGDCLFHLGTDVTS
jgi:predicted deacylase